MAGTKPTHPVCVVVAYHSGFGHTRAIARSVAEGAGAIEGAQARVIDVAELPDRPRDVRAAPEPWKILDEADAIVFGCPTYMGSASAAFKRFMEATSPAWGAQLWRDKLAAGFTNAGGLSGDKFNTLTDLAAFAAQHSMLWVSQGVLDIGLGDGLGVNRLSGFLGLETQAGDAAPDVTPPEEDHATARAFGERIARAALRWRAGNSV